MPIAGSGTILKNFRILRLIGQGGTGKTFVAHAVAGELDAAFFVAKASNLMSQWFGHPRRTPPFCHARDHPPLRALPQRAPAVIPAAVDKNWHCWLQLSNLFTPAKVDGEP